MAQIDMMRAVPPDTSIVGDALQMALLEIANNVDLGTALRTNRPGGFANDRSAAAKWLESRLGRTPVPDVTLVTNGTQSCLSLLMPFLVEDGCALASEALTYPVVTNLAKRSRTRLVAIEVDNEGMVPDALANAVKQDQVSAVFLNPTVHNPTTAVMPEARRESIIAIARQHGIAIIEDDVLGRMHGRTPRPFASLAPDITWYIAAMAKSVTLGLRISFLVCPDENQARCLFDTIATMSSWFPSALAAEVATNLIMTDRALEIERAIMDEIDARLLIAQEALPNIPFKYERGGLHLWIPFSSAIGASKFQQEAERRGVLVRNFEMFRVNPLIPYGGPWGVRVAITNPVDRGDLTTGLKILDELYQAQQGDDET